nr:SPARC-like protein 1 [Misgurnus anguillicaudatus]XP_055061063.1 SPARC-like protein 1 [Misgurnus anguillicaudatus]XP_055061065.1 SPARC-like protein 1 [Misgurnus anguillicaudatus]XP_055061066.1 SPARC-like protein 1 [Misgurnus anguillicaudatus]
MKNHLLLLCFLAPSLAAYVHSKPHDKNQHFSKHNDTPEKQHNPQLMKLNESKSGVLPTFLPFESSTQDAEDEDVSEEKESHEELKQAMPKELKVSEEGKGNSPLLLSEEALTQLLRDSEEAGEPVEDDDHPSGKSENQKETQEENEERGESTNKKIADNNEGENKEEDGTEIDSSTESEIPIDLDYASDSDVSKPLPIKLEEAKQVEKTEDVIPTAMDYDSQQSSGSENSKEDILEEQSEQEVSEEKQQTLDELIEPLQDSENDKNNVGENKPGEDQEKLEREKDISHSESIPSSAKIAKKESSHGKSKGKKQRKKQDMQNDQASTMEANNEDVQRKHHEKDVHPTENSAPKPRKNNGKRAHLVGMNPVQIKASMELYPDIRPTHRPSGQEVPVALCENFRCKRGKTCIINDENKPVCVCQEPSACPPSMNEFDHVCGTDNKTYDTSCQLFATKCGLEGTKMGHRLHLDYTGPCKFIAPCLETELVQFPLRMRDWLKNVLLQLYEHDSMSPGFLTPKQRIKVQKIFEGERRLHAGDHPIELLLKDFEKNYNMYIYPVHWQFAQMDQHPSDRFLSHSELAPLRVPLVPIEHCTSVFFQKCDDDKDKLVSFREWCSCFGIKEEDMDSNLLF